MTEESPEELPTTGDGSAEKVTAEDMAAALEAVQSASPDLAAALKDAQVTPDQLAEAHEAASSSVEEPGAQN